MQKRHKRRFRARGVLRLARMDSDVDMVVEAASIKQAALVTTFKVQKVIGGDIRGLYRAIKRDLRITPL